MFILNQTKGYVLLEVLIALSIASSLIALSLRYEFKLLRKSAEQFQQLNSLNQLRNAFMKSLVNPGSEVNHKGL